MPKEKIRSITMCGGYKFSNREKELEVIKEKLFFDYKFKAFFEEKFDLSITQFIFILDSENNDILNDYEGNNGQPGYWNTLDYRKRSIMRESGNLIIETEKDTLVLDAINNKLSKL